jgi:hypothetical protein
MKIFLKKNSSRGGSIVELALGMILVIIASVGFASYMNAQVRTQLRVQLSVANKEVLRLEESRAQNFDISVFEDNDENGLRFVRSLPGLTEEDDRFYSVIFYAFEYEVNWDTGDVSSGVLITSEVGEIINGSFYYSEPTISDELYVIRN